MIWAYPGTLWLLLVLLPLLFSSLRAWNRARRDIPSLFAGEGFVGGITPWAVRTFFRDFSMAGFLVWTVLAASDPRRGRAPVPGERKGLDVVLLVDVSRSMLAQDIEPYRLDRAVSTIRLLSRSLDDARFALIPFKGDAEVIVPMTEDRTILDNWLDHLGPGVSTIPGTDIEQALRVGREAFPQGAGRQRALLLFTDGESLGGRVDRVSRDLAEEGLAVHTVMTGTLEGAPIRLTDGSFVRDTDGQAVVSRADSEGLRRLAADTGGSYIDISRPGAPTALLREIRDRRDFIETKGIRFQTVSRYRAYLAPALLFFLVSLLVRVVPWRREW